MALGGMLKRLFGGGAEAGPPAPDRSQAVEYKGYRIVPAPQPHGGQYLTAAVIEKDGENGTRVHNLVRADTHASQDDAKAFAILKCRQVIDEQGDRIFG